MTTNKKKTTKKTAVSENSEQIIKEMERMFDRLFKVCVCVFMKDLSRCVFARVFVLRRKKGHRSDIVPGRSPPECRDASDALFLSISSSSSLLCCHSGKGAMKHYG